MQPSCLSPSAQGWSYSSCYDANVNHLVQIYMYIILSTSLPFILNDIANIGGLKRTSQAYNGTQQTGTCVCSGTSSAAKQTHTWSQYLLVQNVIQPKTSKMTTTTTYVQQENNIINKNIEREKIRLLKVYRFCEVMGRPILH